MDILLPGINWQATTYALLHPLEASLHLAQQSLIQLRNLVELSDTGRLVHKPRALHKTAAVKYGLAFTSVLRTAWNLNLARIQSQSSMTPRSKYS